MVRATPEGEAASSRGEHADQRTHSQWSDYSTFRLDPFVQQLLWVHAIEQGIGNHGHAASVRRLAFHLGDGVIRIHRPNRLDAAALRIAVEHRKRCHAKALQAEWGGLRCEECSPGTAL